MKTKTFVLHAAFLLIICSGFAQNKKPIAAISAGISSAYYSTDDDNSNSSDFMTGVSAGFSLRFPTSPHWAINPGLFFVQKGGVETFENIKFTTTLNYVEVPVNIYYSKRNRFFWGFGPSFALGLSGKIKAESESVKINFGSNSEDDLKRFEAGLNLMSGFRFQNNLFIEINLNSTYNNLSNDDESKFFNNYLGIRLGYFFPNKIKEQKSK